MIFANNNINVIKNKTLSNKNIVIIK